MPLKAIQSVYVDKCCYSLKGNTEDLATNLTAAVEDAIQASSIVRESQTLS